MKVSDLVAIGKLGRLEPDGFYCVQFSQSYKSIFNQLDDCFLIFSSDRVFFVTVVETKVSGPRQYLRFKEEGIAEESRKSTRVILALAPEELQDVESEDEVSGLIGYSAVYQDKVLGELSDALINPMQSVLMITLPEGTELLVPNVSQYVVSVDRKKQIIVLQNLDELLELCKSTS